MQLQSHKSLTCGGYTQISKACQGYTLIEILVVVAILALLFTVGYSNFQAYSQRQALVSLGRQITIDLRSAQESAVAGDITSSCSGLLNGYQLKVNSGTTYEIDALCTGGTVQTKAVTISPGITISTPNPNPIIFKSLAQGTNIVGGANATIVMTQTATGNTRTITIGANGSIQ